MAKKKMTSNTEESKVLDLTEELNKVLESTEPMSKEILNIISKSDMTKNEIRFLVDIFYQFQAKRISIQNQIRSIEQEADSAPDNKSPEILKWVYNNVYNMEKSIFKILDVVTESGTGKWLKSNMGIGPTLAAALLAYFDIEQASSAGHFWSYAGLNNNNCPRIGKEKGKAIIDKYIAENKGEFTTDVILSVAKETGRKYENLLKNSYVTNKDGEIKKFKDGYHLSKDNCLKFLVKIPYNSELKVICWKVGQQLNKLINNPKSKYGMILKERKAYEVALNESGAYADQAKEYLAAKNYSKTTDAYKAYITGKLPPAQLQARAERYAVKILISHLFECMYIEKYHTDPPVFYSFIYQNHVDYIGPEVPYNTVFPWYNGKGGALR